VPVMYSALDPIKRFLYLVLFRWWLGPQKTDTP